MSARVLATASLVAACPTPSHAESAAEISAEVHEEPERELLPCRPTITCTAELAPRGAVEVEVGYAMHDGAEHTTHGMSALIKYSVIDRLQLQVGSSYLVVAQQGSDAHALDGVYAGPKVLVLEQTAHAPAVAVSALFAFPTRDGEQAVNRTTDGRFWAYLSKDFAGFRSDLNLGVNVLSIDSAPESRMFAALSAGHDLVGHLAGVVEGYWFSSAGERAERDLGVLVGLQYALAPRVMLDAGVDVAWEGHEREVSVFAGLSFSPYRPDHAHGHDAQVAAAH